MSSPTPARKKPKTRRAKASKARGGDASAKAATSQDTPGLPGWMERAADLIAQAREKLTPALVHDVRVSLRNCRSLGAGLRSVSLLPDLREMNLRARVVFRALSELRDTQVLLEWVERLGKPEWALTAGLKRNLERREAALLPKAREAIESFEPEPWAALRVKLADTLAHLHSDPRVFQHLALVRWQQVHSAHTHALQTLVIDDFHNLRIDIKRLRYTVENFLPELQKLHGKALKAAQTFLGDAHDLDLLRVEVRELGRRQTPEVPGTRDWALTVDRELHQCLSGYMALACDQQDAPGMLEALRQDLPQAAVWPSLRQRSLEALAECLDPHWRHSQRLARLAGAIFDQLGALGAPIVNDRPIDRELLTSASLLHGIARDEHQNPLGANAAKLLQRLDPPAGWCAEDMRRLALILRLQDGEAALPPDHGTLKLLAELSPYARRMIFGHSAILRLVRALDGVRSRAVREVQVQLGDHEVRIRVHGYQASQARDELLLREKCALERSVGRSVVIEAVTDRPSP